MKKLPKKNGFVVLGNQITQDVYVVILFENKNIKECFIANDMVDKPIGELYAFLQQPGSTQLVYNEPEKGISIAAKNKLANILEEGNFTKINISFVSTIDNSIMIKKMSPLS